MQPALLSEPLRLAGAPLLRLQSDQRLVRLVRAGSHPAFAEVVHRYGPALERYTGRIVGVDQAEDVVQQAFARAHTALMADDRPIDLKPWLYRIVHNGALNVLRGRQDELALDDHAHELVVDGVEAQAADRERFRSTLRAVQALPPAQRDALLLRELEGRSHDEIASALGVTAGAARQHLMRARATMRAVVTAITPYPAILKLAALAADGGGGLAAGAAVGGGASLSLSKLGIGLLAAGAVAGGAGVVAPGVVPGPSPKRAETAESTLTTPTRAARPPIATRAAVSTPIAATTNPATDADAHPSSVRRAGHGSRGQRDGGPVAHGEDRSGSASGADDERSGGSGSGGEDDERGREATTVTSSRGDIELRRGATSTSERTGATSGQEAPGGRDSGSGRSGPGDDGDRGTSSDGGTSGSPEAPGDGDTPSHPGTFSGSGGSEPGSIVASPGSSAGGTSGHESGSTTTSGSSAPGESGGSGEG